MLARIHKSLEEKEEGFTLIELLVVMIIIGILAAIAIPTFLNQRKNGWNSATKTDISNMALAVESAAVDKGGDFTNVFVADVAGTKEATNGVLVPGATSGVEFTGSQNVDIALGADVTANSFCLVGMNTNFGTFAAATDGWWTYSKAKGGLQNTVSISQAAAAGLC